MVDSKFDVLTKNGWYCEQEAFGPGQRYMGLYPEDWNHDYSRISATLPKCGGRLAVKEPQGHFRVETSSPNISSNLPNKRDSRDRFVCMWAVTSVSKLFCLETRPIQSGFRCNVTSLGKQIPLCIPTFLNDQQSFKQSKTEQGKQNATCGTHLAISNLVSDSVKYFSRETSTFTTVPVSAHESTKTVACNSDKQNLNISSVDNLWEKLLTGGLSERASQLITICPGHSGLAGVMKEKLIHFDVNVNHLSFLFDARLEYRTIGCHRSAISAYHEYIDGKPGGQHPKVCVLLKGMFNKSTPTTVCVHLGCTDCDRLDKI